MNNIDIVVAYMICKQQKIYGKVALQKILYFIKESGVPIEADYFMHIFGPFSLDVASRYHIFIAKGILKKEPETWGESFVKGENCEGIDKAGQDFLNSYRKRIDSVLDNVRDKYPLDLELYATTHYIIKDRIERGQSVGEGEVVRDVKAEKGPKFSEEDIKKSYSDIMKWFFQEE
jgi:uncharacterized protein YwgA